MADHIVKSFDNELNDLNIALAQMGGLVEAQVADAIKALIKRDTELAARVVSQDKRVDAFEDEVDSRSVRLLALRQPMAEDLRIVIVALKVSADLERIGDYAKNVAKRTTALIEHPAPTSIHTVRRMATIAQGMIKSVLDAYADRDEAKARDVIARDEEVDALHTSLFRDLLTYMMEDPRNITPCTHLLFIAKNIERIGDHATNIAENVLFLVSGELVTGERQKDDAASVVSVTPDQKSAKAE
jgi:phosphate transport system protein